MLGGSGVGGAVSLSHSGVLLCACHQPLLLHILHCRAAARPAGEAKPDVFVGSVEGIQTLTCPQSRLVLEKFCGDNLEGGNISWQALPG